MNRRVLTISLLLVALCACSALIAEMNHSQVDEVDFSPADDSADAAANRPIITSENLAPGMVDISCDDSSLGDIVRQFRKITRANIICSDTTNLQRKVSVELKNVPWGEALRTILNSRGFRLDERNNIYYVEEDENKPITKSYVLNHASAEELADLFNGYALKKEKQINRNGKTEETIRSVESKASAMSGKVHASAFPNANVLVLSGYPAAISECEYIIKAIDRAATQVYIEARFMELSSSAKRELGMKWDSLKSVGVTSSDNTFDNTLDISRSDSSLNEVFKNIGQMAATYGGTYSGTLSASDFSLFLSAFDELGGSQIFSNPRVIISNGKEALIDMTTKFPNLKITSQRNTTSGQSYTDYTAELQEIKGDKDKGLFAGSAFFSWGISLSVKPRISPEGLISVQITPSISELDTSIFNNDGFYQVKGGSDQATKEGEAAYGKYPIIRMKSINTDFTMRDGCTAVIGGLSMTTESDVDTGIPGLRSIPWIGPRLFGWKSREKDQKEIIICVTIGIANPDTLPKDAGLPKNAVISREYIEGRRQEPGDRKNAAETLKDLDSRPLDWHSRYHNPNDNNEEDAVDLENTNEQPDKAAGKSAMTSEESAPESQAPAPAASTTTIKSEKEATEFAEPAATPASEPQPSAAEAKPTRRARRH